MDTLKIKASEIIYLVAIAIVVMLLASCGGSSDSDSGGETENSDTDKIYAIGDTINREGAEITVTDVTRNFDPNDEFSEPGKDKEFVKVIVDIKNNSDKHISYNTFDWSLEDSNGSIEDSTSAFVILDDDLGSGDLAVGGEKKGSMVFEAPKDDAGLILHYTDNIFDEGEKDIKIKLT